MPTAATRSEWSSVWMISVSMGTTGINKKLTIKTLLPNGNGWRSVRYITLHDKATLSHSMSFLGTVTASLPSSKSEECYVLTPTVMYLLLLLCTYYYCYVLTPTVMYLLLLLCTYSYCYVLTPTAMYLLLLLCTYSYCYVLTHLVPAGLSNLPYFQQLQCLAAGIRAKIVIVSFLLFSCVFLRWLLLLLYQLLLCAY